MFSISSECELGNEIQWVKDWCVSKFPDAVVIGWGAHAPSRVLGRALAPQFCQCEATF